MTVVAIYKEYKILTVKSEFVSFHIGLKHSKKMFQIEGIRTSEPSAFGMLRV